VTFTAEVSLCLQGDFPAFFAAFLRSFSCAATCANYKKRLGQSANAREGWAQLMNIRYFGNAFVDRLCP
jgi:hypothetical protein